MRIFSLSASKIKTFKQCEFKYYLSYHLMLSTGTSFAAEQGSMVHVIFEKLGQDIRDGIPLDDSYIYNNWRKEVLYAYREEELWRLSKLAEDREKQCTGCPFNIDGTCEVAGKPIDSFAGCPKDEYEDAINLCEKVIANKEVMFPLDRKIIDVEDVFKLEIPDGDNDPIVVNGIIDVVTELDDDTIEIVDYKTGKYIQSYNECAKDPQLLIYNLAVRRQRPEYKDVFITIYYLRRRPLTLTFEARDEEGTENALRHYYHTIKAIESPVRRCDRYGEGTSYDYVCDKMCDRKLCDEQWELFKANGKKILDPPENPVRERKEWLAHLLEGSQKEAAYQAMQKEKAKLIKEIPTIDRSKDEKESKDSSEGTGDTGEESRGSLDKDATGDGKDSD